MPDIYGFSAELGFVTKHDNDGRAKMDLGLIYANGPVSVGFSYNKEKGRDANYALGAKYSFGAFAVSAGYYDARNWLIYDNAGRVVSDAGGNEKGFSLGGSAKFGAIGVAVEVARSTKSSYVQNGVTYPLKKYTNIAVEGRYSLSKRTFIYADYIRLIGGNNYGIGVQHSF